MKKPTIIAFLLLVLLQGCAFDSFFQKKDTAIISTTEKVGIDSRVLLPCEPLKPLIVNKEIGSPQTSTVGFDTILENLAINTRIYSDCASKQDNSIKLLKQFGGIK